MDGQETLRTFFHASVRALQSNTSVLGWESPGQEIGCGTCTGDVRSDLMAHCATCKNPQHVGKVTICECACVTCRNSTIDDLARLAEAHEREVAELRRLYELAVKPG